MISSEERRYHAVVWRPEPNAVGIRVTIVAKDLADAKPAYGDGAVFNLHNEEDADKLR